MNFLPEFKKYLFSQSLPSSKVTVKNYVSDVSRFIRWFEATLSSFSPELVTIEIIEQFKTSSNLAPRSTERSLSSLRKFFNFLVLEGVISESPLELDSKLKIEDDPYRLKDFRNYLYVYNASKLTIKNYLMDIKKFLSWAQEVTDSKNAWDIKEKDVLGRIDNYFIEEYKRRLPYSPRTINRKLSSLRKYLKWAESEGLIHARGGEVEGLPTTRMSVFRERALAGGKLRQDPELATLRPTGPLAYSKFPPFRLAQKTVLGIALLPDYLIIKPLASLLKAGEYLKWKVQGKPVFEKLRNKAAARLKIKSLPKESFAPFSIATTHLPLHKKLLFHVAHTRPNWYRRYHEYHLSNYFHLAILIVFMSAIGFGVYQSLFPVKTQGVLGFANPQVPPRILSFQGKLTDSSDNPITSSTNLRFALYDSPTGSGSALLWQEIDTVTPDSDGIFSLLLGNRSTMGQDLFAMRAGLWLGVTVGQTAELTPRQRLATVAYAENADNLQGLPPITQSGAGTSNVVLALDSAGNLTIGGTATPTFQATGGQFTLSGNPLLLTTTSKSNTDVENVKIAPSGWSFIDLQKPLQNSTNNNNIPSALGALEVDDMFAVLATSSGQSALTVNQNGAGPIISASSSGVPKFTVDNSGNTTIAGGNLSQTGSGTFSTGTGAISLNGDVQISSGKNFTVTLGNTSLTSSTATSNALSLTDTALTSGTGFNQTYTLNAGNGQTSVGQSINLTDSTIAGGGYTGLAVTITGSGVGSGNKYLLDLNPGNVNREIIVDSTGSLRPTQGVSTNTTSIGSPSFYFKNGFFDQITANTIAGTVSGGSTSSTTWTLGSTQTGDVNEALIFQRNSGSGNATLQWNAGSGDLRYLTANYPLNTTYTVNNTSIGTTIDLLSANLTNNTTSGTQRLLSLTNTGTGTTTNGIYLNNSGTGTTGVEIAGTWGTGLLTNNNTINAGTGSITSGAITTSGNFSQTGATTFSTGTGNVSLNGNVLIAANETVQLSSGTGTITQNYSNNTGTGTTLSITDSASSGTTTVNGLGLALVGTANATGANTLNALNFSNVTAQTNNTYNALNLGTGYTNFITSGTVNLTAAGALSGLTTVSASGSISTTGTGTITSAGLLTASNGLTLTTGALNLTGTSGSTSITGYGTTSITSTTASGNILTLADASFTTTGANLANFTFTNTNAGAGAVTTNGLSITPTGTTITGGGSNTLNAINLPNVTAIASNTFNGLNFGTGYNNLVNSANWTVTAAGAETIAGNFSQTGATTLSTGTGAISLNGNTALGSGKTFTWTTGAIDTNGKLGVGTTGPGAQLEVDPGATTTIGQIIKAQASQTADLLQIQNSLAGVIAKVDSLGNITGNTLTSTVAQGTAPLTVTSTTVVANLNAAAAQQPNPNLVLNSDFGRRNSWMTFMVEAFTDTNDGMTVLAGSANQSVSANVLTPGTTDGTRWLAQEGLTTWKDARFSGQIKWNSGLGGIGKTFDVNNMVIATIESTAFSIWKRVGGTFTNVSTTAITAVAGNTYWVELEAQGTTYIAKLYSSGGTTYVAKSSATLSNTITATIADTGVASGSFGYWNQPAATNNLYGGISASPGGVYVEGWGPESWTVSFNGILGGQSIGFDESTDAGPIGKQWAVKVNIPGSGTTREVILDFNETAITGGANATTMQLKPSTTYALSTYIKTSGTNAAGTLGTTLYSKTQAGVSDTSVDILDNQEASWTQKTKTLTTGSTGRFGGVRFDFNRSNNGNGTYWVDLAQVEEGAVTTPWRNAPADDDPIVWELERRPLTNISLTNTVSLAELDPRDLAANYFLPWDATVHHEIALLSVVKDASSTTLYVLPSVDADGAGQPYSIKKVFTTSPESAYGSRVVALSAGKHRATIQEIIDAATVTVGNNAFGQARMTIRATKGKTASNSSANDLAEEYSVTDPTIEAGDVVRVSGNQGSLGSASVERTDKGYDPFAFGVISTAPAITFGNYDPLTGKIIDTSQNRWTTGTDRRPVALSGRVPVKVTNENGAIHRGDTLTSSEKYPGYAMRAARAGRSIGIAMEDFAPTDNGTVQTGEIMTFVNLSWYDPDVYLTSTGDFVINKVQNTTQVASATPDPQTGLYNSPSPSASSSASPTSEPNCQTTTDPSNFGLLTSACPQTKTVNYAYKITDSLGSAVQRVGAFSELVVGTLRSGLIQTKDLIADNINVNNKIISPIAEIQTVRTDTISPLSSNKVVIKLDPSTSSGSHSATPSFEIQNASGSAVATFDDKGNTSLSGQLSAKTASISGNLTTNDATVSGTLKAKNIIADNIDTQIFNLKSQISSLTSPISTSSAIDIASYSAQLANVDTLQAQVGTFMQGLFAVGPSSLSDANIFGQLSIGGNLILTNGSINVLGSDLKLQPLGQGGILLGKKISIDSDGNLNVNGDAKFNGTLFANVISPIPGNDLAFKLLNKNATDSAKIRIVNASGSAVATIDQNGDAMFRKLNLNLVSPAFALSDNEVVATGSAGVATISARLKELTIDNNLVTDKSLIYITPVGTSSAMPFLLRQESNKSFTVGIPDIKIDPTTFNWLIIN